MLRKIIRNLLIVFNLIAIYILAPVLGMLFMPMDTDEYFKQTIADFERDIQIKVHTTIKARTLNRGSAVGICYMTVNRVFIDRKYLERNPDLEVKSTIYHEIGHCQCKLRHNEDVTPDACPVSLMYPETMPYHCLQKNWAKYIKRLKRECHGKGSTRRN